MIAAVEPKHALPGSYTAAAWGFLLAPMACAALLIGWPRAVEPELVPTLALSAGEVQAVVAQDAREAALAPKSALADELRGLLSEQGASEVRGSEGTEAYGARRARLAARCTALVAAAGEPAARALRAEAVQRVEDALAGRLPVDQARIALGAMPSMLAREGAARDGTLLAPHFVLRTLYKARINLLFGRKPDHDLARVERLAFFGYQALHARRLPILRRVEALRAYGRDGGPHADEALGVLLYLNGEPIEASEVLASVAKRGAGLRARDYAAAAEMQAKHARAMGR